MQDRNLREPSYPMMQDPTQGSAGGGNIYTEMQETLLDLQRDLDTYRAKIDNALVLLSIIESRQARRENYQQYEMQLNEIQQLITQSMATVNQQGKTADEPQPAPEPMHMQMPMQMQMQMPAEPRVAPEKPIKAAKTPKPEAAEVPEKKRKKKSRIGDILFYGILVVLLIGVFVVQMTSGNGVKTFMGFSAFVVKTSSMESVYPKGSLIVTRDVDADSLAVGDDITYMANETTTITHRIIAIYENYEGTNERGFETQGVMNKDPDANIVPEVNIVGKVIFGSMFLGQAWSFIGSNWPILVFGLVVIVALSFVLRYIFKQPDEK